MPAVVPLRVALLVTACFGGAFGLLGAPLRVGAALASSTARTEKLVDCTGKPVVKPTEIIITCADAGEVLQGIHWSRWTTGDARGTGTYVLNTCTPDCAAGKFVRYHATFELSGRKQDRHGLVFTALRWRYEVGGKAKQQSFSLVG
ncbi:MAG: hypothetical protein JWM85_59 [Acidimicrobiaceae bacterium]|nr:hypothetical protein [Acidimicrobiaceae bacterium]